MFTFESVVRFSEVDTDGYLGLKGILNYFQDCSELQSDSLDNGFVKVHLEHHFWVLNSWQIQIKKKPKLGDKIFAGTAPHQFRSFEGQRNFFILDENKEVLVNANSIWTFLDMETLRPVKVDDEQLKKYALDPPYEMDYAPRKIDIRKIEEAAYTKICEIEVKDYMLDMNKHVNNAWYVIATTEYVPKDFEYNQVRVDYRKAAYLGDVLILKEARVDDKLVHVLSTEDGTVYNIIEYSNI